MRYEVWRELQWIWDAEKSTQYLFGQPQIPATVGCELVVPQRRMELPQAKRQKYERLANELCADAVSHPRALVESVKLERVIGQLLHAADFYIEMWIFFLELIYSIGSDIKSSQVKCIRMGTHQLFPAPVLARQSVSFVLKPFPIPIYPHLPHGYLPTVL